MKALIRLQALVPVTIKKKGKWFIAACEKLDVITQGETEEKAKRNLEDAIMGHIQIMDVDETAYLCKFQIRHPKIFTDTEIKNVREGHRLAAEHLKKYPDINPELQNALAKEFAPIKVEEEWFGKTVDEAVVSYKIEEKKEKADDPLEQNLYDYE